MKIAGGSPEPPMPIRWQVEADDLVRGERIANPRLIWFLRYGGPILIVLAAGASLLHVEAIVSVPLLALGFGLIFDQFGRYPERIEKQVRGLAGHEIEVRADEAGLHLDVAGNHVWREWPTVSRLTETATSIVIWRARERAFILPKRAFPDPSEAAAFMAYVRAHLVVPPATEASHRPSPPSDR
jgi:hypothetical protein